MGTFSNITRHQEMTSNFVSDFKNRLSNPFYMFQNVRPTSVTYYNINNDYSSFDQGNQTIYSEINENSPLRFNKISGFFIYGFGNADISSEKEDYGVEASEISGDAYILPNTIKPSPYDFFKVDYLDQDILFKITSVSPDTLPNGNNYYKITYKLQGYGNKEGNIDKLVIRSMLMIIDNLNSGYKVIVDEEDYSFYSTFSEMIDTLKEYYIAMFYSSQVDTFVFKGPNGGDFYDPYLIEFLIRNKVLKRDKEFIHIMQQVTLDPMFEIEYDRTVFRAIELCSLDKLKKYNKTFCGIEIEDMTSLLTTRLEPYYQMVYHPLSNTTSVHQFKVFDEDVFENITNHKMFTEDKDLIQNIIIRYFNDDDIRYDIANILDSANYVRTKEMFYTMAIVIYIMNDYIDTYLKDNTTDTESSSLV